MNRVGLIMLGDLIAFLASFILILLVRFGATYQTAIATHIVPFIILYLSWILVFFIFGLYEIFTIKPTIPHLSRFGIALLTCFGLGIFLFYFVPIFGIAPKTNLIFQTVGFGFISFLIRRIIYSVFSKNITRPVILIGSSSCIGEINSIISTNPQLGLKIIARTDDPNEAITKYGDKQNTVFIFENIPSEISKENILNLYKNGAEVVSVSQAYERYLQKIPVENITQSWIIENINIKENIVYFLIRKIIDIVFALSVLIVTSPLVIISMISIYLYDQKDTFYMQERVGVRGKLFKLYKLRSMIVDSETNGAVWADKKDSRITPIGRIIRKTHIDEIPQMINILRGDITLVGPRPERPEFVKELEDIIPHYQIRHIIRPGFTGWAQIKYRYARTINDSREKFEYDLYYIKNKNIFLDFGIVLRTIQIIFMH